MKKIIAFFMTAVIVCSMGVTTAFGAKAYESNAKLSLNNEGSMYLQPYTIDGYTYFGLREVCGALQGTVNEFDLNWNSGSKTTVIKTKTTGVPIISMSYTISYGQIIATPVDVAIEVDGQMVNMKAYNINSYNYFKLRDLADIIGFEVEWNAATKTINIVSPFGSPTPPVQKPAEQKTEGKIEPVQKGPAVRDHEVLVSVKEGQRKVVENTIFNKEVRISFNDYDSVAIFKDCTFNDKISVSGDYDLDESLIFENCKIKGDIIEIPKWK